MAKLPLHPEPRIVVRRGSMKEVGSTAWWIEAEYHGNHHLSETIAVCYTTKQDAEMIAQVIRMKYLLAAD